ncbi:MAG TPA: SMI1/KNR4 family protein [Vitreoscilla sp.]|nr:SMI1/KNR4 family protein [Vitreoscilla sp.]
MDKLNKLLKQYQALLLEDALVGCTHDALVGCTHDDLHKVELYLDVTLPDDFKEISLFCSIDYLGGMPNYQVVRDGNALNLIDETLRIRNGIGLPHEYVFLGELDTSAILLNTIKQPHVIWVDSIAIERLNQLESHEYDVWENYQDYFEYLLQEEFSERNLDA